MFTVGTQTIYSNSTGIY